MTTWLDKVLSRVDAYIERLGPVTALIDTLVSHIAPTTTAKACGEGYYCCGVSCGGASFCCGQYPGCEATVANYARNASDCASGHYTVSCFLDCGC